MSIPVLSVQNVGKSFRQYDREIDRVAGWFNLSKKQPRDNWVLRDISFNLYPGEAIGIIGRNGAGKSTLLKMIAGIMRPSEGQIGIKGRISAILELGMGFNPEITGLKNVIHAAGMMGFSSEEITAALPGIREFSELGEFFDKPLRIYSSGMQMRLAFAVATSFRPDILIVDEALAVGDTYFQHKSMERIRKFQKDGTVMILVSHDKVAIQTLCTRALLLNEGKLALDGEPESVLDYYNALLAKQEGEDITVTTLPDGRVQTVSGSGKAKIKNCYLLDAQGKPTDTFNVGREANLVVEAEACEELDSLVMGYSIKDRLGTTLYGTNTAFSEQTMERVKAGTRVEYSIKFPVNLGPGSYSIALALTGGESHLDANYEWRDMALVFDVVNLDKAPFDGKFYLPPQIEVSQG